MTKEVHKKLVKKKGGGEEDEKESGRLPFPHTFSSYCPIIPYHA